MLAVAQQEVHLHRSLQPHDDPFFIDWSGVDEREAFAADVFRDHRKGVLDSGCRPNRIVRDHPDDFAKRSARRLAQAITKLAGEPCVHPIRQEPTHFVTLFLKQKSEHLFPPIDPGRAAGLTQGRRTKER